MEKIMDSYRSYVFAPRIEVVLVPKNNRPKCKNFETWLVLHVPDGAEPTTVKLADTRKQKQSIEKILEIYTAIGEKFCFPGTDIFPDRPTVH
jgi:hypothetical protein